MPDHSPTERRQAIIQALRSEQWQRAEDLAEALGVSRRTIYRDVQALLDTGLPIVGVPGTGYRLDLGLRCAPPEAVTPEGASAVERALREALAAQQTVRFPYHEGASNGTTAAPPVTVNPYGLVLSGVRGGYLVGWCHERGCVHHFQLRRMGPVTLTGGTFERPASYAGSAPIGRPTAETTVRLLFSRDVAPHVRSADALPAASLREREDGLEATLRVPRATDLLPWILSWGAQVQVMAPEALQERVAREARGMAAQYERAQRLL